MKRIEEEPKENKTSEKTIACQECPAGIMHLSYITYFTWLNEELVTVPNFPAWVCDVCGRREFDPRTITWLNTLLHPSAGRPSIRHTRRKSKSTGTDYPRP